MTGATVAVVGWEAVETSADEAVADLYRSHGAWLVGLLEVFVGDRPTAEDVAQEAFVRVHRAWPRLRDPERAAGYLRVTALNIARSGFRRRIVAQRHRPEPAAAAEGADTGVVLRDEQRAVIEAIRTLPRRQRECVVLKFYGDLSESEIGATLRISPNSVKTHMRRGMAALQAQLEEIR